MRKSFVSLFSLVLLLGVILAVGCGGGGGGGTSPVAPAADGSLADLSGKVTYQGKPVANAAVYLVKATEQKTELSRRASVMTQAKPDFSVLMADGNGYQTTTGSQGEYQFSQVPVGSYNLIAMTDPTHQVSQSVVVGSISNLDLALKPTGSISGKLVMNGQPIAAMVYLQGTSYIGIADLTGAFTIQNIPVSATPYVLIPITGGYESSYAFKNSPLSVSPVAGVNTDLGTLELTSALATLKGVATLASGTDFSNIFVYVDSFNRQYPGSYVRATTTSTGSYEIPNISFGNHSLYYFLDKGAGDTYFASQTITVSSIGNVAVPQITLKSESSTSAKIDVAFKGIVNSDYVYFQLWRKGDPSYTYITPNYTYGPATFTYSNLTPGEWGLKLTSFYNYTLGNAAPGYTDQVASITVNAGGYATFTVNLLPNYANISGTVSGIVSPAGQMQYPSGSSYNYVYLYQNGTQVNSAYLNISGTSGTYTFNGIATGTYSVVVPQYNYQLASVAVTLAPGDQKTQNLTLNWLKAAVSGTVNGVNANYPATIRLWQNGSLLYSQTGLTNGSTYTFLPLNAGVYSVDVDPNSGYSTASYAVTLAAGNQKTQNFTLTLSVPVVSAASFNGPGTVLSVTGTGFNATNAEILVDGSSIPVTNRTGTTSLTGDSATTVNPGIHTITVRNNGALISQPVTGVAKQFPAGPAIGSGVIGTETYTMTWSPVAGATGYNVYIDSVLEDTTTGNTYTFDLLDPNTDYSFSVEAIGNGISNSPQTSVAVTTNKVYSTPVALNTGIAITSFLGSYAKNGAIFSVIDNGTGLQLVKYDLNTQATTTANLTAPGGQTFETFYLNTSPYNSDIYIVWKGGNSVTVEQFMFGTLSGPANTFTSTFPGVGGYPGAAQGARIITDPATPYNLKIMTWGTIGDITPVFVASYTIVNTNLAGAVESPAPLPATYDNKVIWTPITGSDGQTYFAMSFNGAGASPVPEYKLFDSSDNLVDYTSLSGLYDLTASPLTGVVLVDSSRSYFMKPPSSFGGFSFSAGGNVQSVIDGSGKFYFYQQNGSLCTLLRYSASGDLLDSSDFRDGVDQNFGEKGISYDASTGQVLIARNVSGTLGFAAFNTAD